MGERIEGRVVAITGGGRGIGAATAAALAAKGARVVIGDIDLDVATETAARIGHGVRASRLDVTDAASFRAFLDEAEAEVGPLDVLVNNAGIMPLATVRDEHEDVTARILRLNVEAVIRGTREAVRRMVPRGCGHIVNVASTEGCAGIPGGATYCASKSAVITFSEAAELEVRDAGVRVSCVMPAIVHTELSSGLAELRGVTSVTPEDVADAIVAALVEPRFEVFVPAYAGMIVHTLRLLPRRSREWLTHRLGADRVLLDAVKSDARRAYESRATGAGRAGEAEPAAKKRAAGDAVPKKRTTKASAAAPKKRAAAKGAAKSSTGAPAKGAAKPSTGAPKKRASKTRAATAAPADEGAR